MDLYWKNLERHYLENYLERYDHEQIQDHR